MFRRKKPEGGFEWHEYIRTTIRLRRDKRRQKVEDARRAAGQQMKAAGVALAAGSRAAGGAAVHGARAGAGALGLLLQGAASVVAHLVRSIVRPVAGLVARPNIGVPVALAGALVLGAGIGRARAIGVDAEAAMTLLAGAVLSLSLLPMLARLTAWRPPRIAPRAAAAAAGLAVLTGGAAWLAGGGGSRSLAILDRLPLIGSGKPLDGYAHAVGADSLRISNTVVRLSDVEAPEPEQRCGKAGRTWRCAAAAEFALARLVNGRRVSCALSGNDTSGRALARCTVGRKDVGAELVRQGHVFAEGVLLPRYGGEEGAARAAKAGLWSGEIERPAAYRAKATRKVARP
jgi:endonuclease YncB( thermonuclease family)